MSSYTVSTPYGDVPVTLTERGSGSPVLLLHGGAGPDSVTGFADQLAARLPVRVLTPVHPGFGGTPRPSSLDSISALASVYRSLLAELGLTGVTVAGSSIGGWIAAELALAAPDRVRTLILLDAAGLDSAAHPIVDFFALTPAEIAELSWANPEGHQIDVAAMTDAQRAVFAGNRAALLAYGGQAMADPSLAGAAGGHDGADARGLGRGRPDRHARLRQGVRGGDTRALRSAWCRGRDTCRSWRTPRRCWPCSRSSSGRTRWRGTRGRRSRGSGPGR